MCATPVAGRRNAGRGLATLCIGGGQGQAAIIRNGAD
jgi:acetyl-CoA acetyltransferase